MLVIHANWVLTKEACVLTGVFWWSIYPGDGVVIVCILIVSILYWVPRCYREEKQKIQVRFISKMVTKTSVLEFDYEYRTVHVGGEILRCRSWVKRNSLFIVVIREGGGWQRRGRVSGCLRWKVKSWATRTKRADNLFKLLKTYRFIQMIFLLFLFVLFLFWGSTEHVQITIWRKIRNRPNSILVEIVDRMRC